MMNKLRIATRKSPLALWQAEFVKQALLDYYPELNIELVAMTTEGDRQLMTSLSKVGGKGLFVKELEQALLDGRADIAVHSMKDVPMEFPTGLALAAICERDDPRDALVANNYQNLDQLPQGSIVGTSSLRRQSQLKALRPDLIVEPLRGNVNTRLQKLDEGHYSAIILAAAGLKRLAMTQRICSYLTPEQCLPAVGQGALGIEYCQDNRLLYQLVSVLNHKDSALCVNAERAMSKRLGSGCQVPVAGFAVLQQQQLWLRGLVGQPDGRLLVAAEVIGDVEKAESLGVQLAETLLNQGADRILQDLAG